MQYFAPAIAWGSLSTCEQGWPSQDVHTGTICAAPKYSGLIMLARALGTPNAVFHCHGHFSILYRIRGVCEVICIPHL